ncbi:MAG TPA: hypothetical protein VMU51_02375 [Mycobacteriales bacterium]|nr:hypothetical protein [Mycobacteriales bacterium]
MARAPRPAAEPAGGPGTGSAAVAGPLGTAEPNPAGGPPARAAGAGEAPDPAAAGCTPVASVAG